MNINTNMLISFGLVIFSLILFLILRKAENGLKALAMSFGCLGDMTLAQFWIFKDLSFVWGVIFFIICHIFYFFAYKRCVKNLFNKGFWIGEAIILLFLIGLIIISYLYPMNEPYPYFGLGVCIFYGLIIGFVCSVVTAFAYEKRSILSILNVLGIISFIISDFIIGTEMVSSLRISVHLIWIFYPIGQFLLILDWKTNKKEEIN